MKQLIEEFQTQPFKIKASYASSGKLYAQIVNGAPYHAFLSADENSINKLINNNLAPQSSAFIYAQGRLVLFSRNPKVFPVNNAVFNLSDLSLTIANPKLAPYGASAHQYLADSHPHWLQGVILGENISQTFQFVMSGNADLGLVSYSQILASQQPHNQWWLIPGAQYPKIKQKAALTQAGLHNAAANAFLVFLRSDKAINIIRQNGYAVTE